MGSIIQREQLTGAAPFSFADLERQGRELVAQATARARQIIADAEAAARRRAAEIEQAARTTGFEQGWRAAQEKVEREVRQAALEEGRRVAAETARENVARLTEALTALVTEFEQRKHSLVASAEAGLIHLAVAIARRVCKMQIEASAEAVRGNARALVDMVQHVADVELHLNPAEYELLCDLAGATVQRLTSGTHVTLVADADVPRGGCVLRTRALVIDASIEQQLQRIAAAICAHAAEGGNADESGAGALSGSSGATGAARQEGGP